MLHTSLVSFLDGEMSAAKLWQEIEVEVSDCLNTCAAGETGHVIIAEGPEALVTRQHLHVLLGALLEGELPLHSASYIADALIMSDCFDFADNTVTQVISALSDESGPLERQHLETLYRDLLMTV